MLLTAVGRTDLDASQSPAEITENKHRMLASLRTYELLRERSPAHVWIAPAHDYNEYAIQNIEWIHQNNPFWRLAMDDSNAESTERFVRFFEHREKQLAVFDRADIAFCVKRNKICGSVHDVPEETLHRLWNKQSGACG